MQILVADDHNLVREGLKPFLRQLGDNAEILEAGTLDEAANAVTSASDLRLVLLDLKMPGMNGLKGLQRIVHQRAGVPVVILSGHINSDDVRAAMSAGAQGYIPKTMSGASMLNALRLVLSGEKYLPSTLLAEADLSGNAEPPILVPNRGPEANGTPLSKLSNRETEILGHLITGMTNKEIARLLELQEITIKIHLRNVYRKIGAANRAQAVRIALSSGWKV